MTECGGKAVRSLIWDALIRAVGAEIKRKSCMTCFGFLRFSTVP